MRFALAGLGLIALGAAAPANAADIRLPVKAAPPAYVQTYYNWTGFYLGALSATAGPISAAPIRCSAR